MYIESIHVHPLKSGRGNLIERATIEALGLEHDRRWMVCDEKGRFFTGRTHPHLVLINVLPDGTGATFSVAGLPDLRVEHADMRNVLPVNVWRHDFDAFTGSDEADFWFSDFLGVSCRLVYTDQRTARRTSADPMAPVSFADGYPLLLIGSASLEDLNTRLDRPVTMRHFRPNLVVKTSEPYIEDRIARLKIGDAVFENVKRCARCVFTTLDPDSATFDAANEPLNTLNGYRADIDGTCLGVNLIARTFGEVSLGDAVEVLQWK